MPKLKRAVPKYRKHKTGQAVVSIGGVDHYLGLHGTDVSRAEYDRVILEYLAAGRDVSVVNGGGRSVAQLLAPFWKYAKEYYVKNGKPTSEVNAFKQVIETVAGLYADTPADEFGPLALKTVREDWIRKGIVRKKVNQRTQRVVRIWKWAVGEELVRPETWQALMAVEGLKKSRTSAPESVPVPPVEIERVQDTIPHLSPVLSDMIRMQLLTGMRPGEVCSLRPCDLDRDRDVWEFRPQGHKTEHHGRERVVYIGPQAKAVLAPYLFRDAEAHCFSAAESHEWYRADRAKRRKTPKSCGNVRGDIKAPKYGRTFFDSSTYCQAIQYGCKKAWPAPDEIADDPVKVKAWVVEHRWAPNQIRHTRATEIRKKFGLEAAQVILGHATADITQVYAERDAEKARAVIRQIG